MGLRHIAAAALFLSAIAVACSPAVRPGGASPFDEDDPEAYAADQRAAPAAAYTLPAAPRARLQEGSVDREALAQVIDEGPAAFLAGVELKPTFRDERFAGWEVVRFWPNDPRFESVDLRPGDVVSEVNGRKIVKPKHFHAVWEELRDADQIVVRGTRAGAQFELRFQVVGAPPAPVP
jgi:type II secretory pathway component PulC